MLFGFHRYLYLGHIVHAQIHSCRLLTEDYDTISQKLTDIDSWPLRVPPQAWLPILPQLVSSFAAATAMDERPGAAKVLLAVLSGILEVSPRAVLMEVAFAHAALVDTTATSRGDVKKTLKGNDHSLEEVEDDEIEKHDNVRSMQVFSSPLLEACHAAAPELTQQATLFAQEMAKIARLEDERWYALLQEARSLLKKRLGTLYPVVSLLRTTVRDGGMPITTSLSKCMQEEYRAAVAPVRLALQAQLGAIPTVGPSADMPHAKMFYADTKLVDSLRGLIDQLDVPLDCELDEPHGRLELALQFPLNCIDAVIQQVAAYMKTEALSLQNLSKSLHQLRDTLIPIPVHTQNAMAVEQGPLLVSIDKTIKVLGTKTRPKKLVFLCNDGSEHTFLIKGNEDLRVDCYIGSFVDATRSAVNALYGKQLCNVMCGANPLQSLIVVPVSRHAGLVKWADSTSPLYEMYVLSKHKLLDKERALKEKTDALEEGSSSSSSKGKQGRGGENKKARRGEKERDGKGKKRNEKKGKIAASTTLGNALHAPAKQQQQEPIADEQLLPVHEGLQPVKQFKNLLKLYGIDYSKSSRSQWPISILRRVFQLLSISVDHSFIAHALRVDATSPSHWWARQHTFAVSTAAMSITGHFLGIGDRHLDNILFNLRDGSVLHVDFGVVFDKGLSLAVPENVPFRLTKSIVKGLGATGTDGVFASWSSRVLHAIRSNKDHFTELVSTFVNDRTVNWNQEAQAKMFRKAYERYVDLSFFHTSLLARKQDDECKETGNGTNNIEECINMTASCMNADGNDGMSSTAFVACVHDLLDMAQNAVEYIIQQIDAMHAELDEYSTLFTRVEELSKRTQEAEAAIDALRSSVSKIAPESSLELMKENGQALLTKLLEYAEDIKAAHARIAQQAQQAYQECIEWQHKYEAAFSEIPLLQYSVLDATEIWDPSYAQVALGMLQGCNAHHGLVPAGSIIETALGMEPQNAPLSDSLMVELAAADATMLDLLSKVRNRNNGLFL